MGLDIWPVTTDQVIGIKDMISTIWFKEALKQRQCNLREYHLLKLSTKKACYIYLNNDSN